MIKGALVISLIQFHFFSFGERKISRYLVVVIDLLVSHKFPPLIVFRLSNSSSVFVLRRVTLEFTLKRVDGRMTLNKETPVWKILCYKTPDWRSNNFGKATTLSPTWREEWCWAGGMENHHQEGQRSLPKCWRDGRKVSSYKCPLSSWYH